MNDRRFQRTAMLYGDAAVEALEGCRVLVVGVGGVGGYVVEVLARSAVGAIDVVDGDTVDITNINRQLLATTATIGRAKVDVARERILNINPRCTVRAMRMYYSEQSELRQRLTDYDYVVDCVDTMSAKVDLALACRAAGVPLISSMGAANKDDATAFRVLDISKTDTDPLARVLRKKLRRLGVDRLKVVCSTEKPAEHITTDDEESQKPGRPTPASNAFVPAAAGIIIGGEVVKDLILRAMQAG